MTPKPKTPRSDKYKALLARFFETTIVLYIIKQVSGPPMRHSLDESTLVASQRRLLNNLAFVLDYTKGGDSTTSVAIEEREDCYKFWMASNQKPDKKVRAFLNEILEELKRISTAGDKSSTAIAEKCCAFAKDRIKKEIEMLRFVQNCEKDLRKNTYDLPKQGKMVDIQNQYRVVMADNVQDKESLVRWLQEAKLDKKTDPFEACMFAFEHRNDPQMQMLLQLGQEFIPDVQQAKRSPFLTVRHYIGRLAAHIRVAEQLVEDSSRLSKLFQAYEVDLVTPPDCVPPPEKDDQTSLDRILNRLLPTPNEDIREEHRNYLNSIDDAIGLEKQIYAIYDDKKAKPRVHSEIQILEKFYREQLPYANDDPFIGTSKPACLCCRLYIQHHPAGCAVPDSHQKVYLNWGPILLPEGTKDPGYKEQRDVLNKVRNELRNIALNQIKKGHISGVRRADSVTALTHSDPDVRSMVDYSDMENEFLSGDSGVDVDPSVRPSVGLDGYDEDAASGDDSDTEGGVKL